MAVKSIKRPQKTSAPAEAARPDEARAAPRADAPRESNDSPSNEAIRQRIAELAYYRAQQRGFSPGYEVEDWLAAEAEVKRNGLSRAG